ncbi:hypothetical protein PHLCEN_2v5712 [Hermanssonia centrifuga]|uniref:Uncharacterized protein n=1 Tax=Hermanssonia centrifuga TaxID=98765 RepID=A0A2R6P1K7_9APHY|nr:hypothetical protein PHLCEN_2v5712 [Hermanssonia centrifuga]
MFSRRIVRFAQAPIAIRATPGIRFVSRGYSTDKKDDSHYQNPEQKGDVYYQAHKGGQRATDPKESSSTDAANPSPGKQADRNGLSGNPEKIGFADQVGSQSASGSKQSSKSENAEGFSGEERITPPSFLDAVKKKLGFKTTAGEDKQNRGMGKGVTGTGHPKFDSSKRTIHTSAAWKMPDQTRGQAPEESRHPKDSTHGDQNAHLKHKASASVPDSGKGNAAEEPSLPSQHVDAAWKPSSSGQQRRGFSTSTRVLQDDKGKAEPKSKHTAESYFRDVENTEPVNPKIHVVDASSKAAPVARANEQPATGGFSRAGSETEEYKTTSKHDQPYDHPPTKGPQADEKLRYGGKSKNLESPSEKGEGPSGKDAKGMKPEDATKA